MTREYFPVKDEYFTVDRKRKRYDELKRKRFGFWKFITVRILNSYEAYKKYHTYIMRRKIMPLVTSKEMLLKAQKGGYAVGAFNAENMEMVKAIIQAAEELKAPVMIQTTPSTIKYGTVETYAAIVAAEAQEHLFRYAFILTTAAALSLLCRQCMPDILLL